MFPGILHLDRRKTTVYPFAEVMSYEGDPSGVKFLPAEFVSSAR